MSDPKNPDEPTPLTCVFMALALIVFVTVAAMAYWSMGETLRDISRLKEDVRELQKEVKRRAQPPSP